MNTKIRTLPAITISAAIALGYSAAGVAANTSDNQPVSDGVNKYVVRFPDLDLSKIDGAATLYGRLRHAARMVCDPLQSRDLGIAAKYRACVEHAIANAVASVGRPLVSQYHETRTKGDKAPLVQLAKIN
jgi:UrcA family protein